MALPDPRSELGWRRFRLILAGLFVARGVAHLCVLPPLEGWDEYQHLAYVQYLHEHARIPIYRSESAFVSPALLLAAARLPQPEPMARDLRSFGARGYEEFWSEAAAPALAPDDAAALPRVGLYATQHGPLYYALALPLHRLAGGVEALSASIALLRMLGVLLAGLAIHLTLGCIGRLVRDRGDAARLGLVIALQPLFLLNAARVSNDALAILLATLAIVWSLEPRLQSSPTRAAGAGVALAGTFLTKLVGLVAAPLVALAAAISVRLGQLPARSAWRSLAIAFGVALMVAAPGLVFNLRHYGAATSMVEPVLLRDQALGVGSLVAAADDRGRRAGRERAPVAHQGRLRCARGPALLARHASPTGAPRGSRSRAPRPRSRRGPRRRRGAHRGRAGPRRRRAGRGRARRRPLSSGPPGTILIKLSPRSKLNPAIPRG